MCHRKRNIKKVIVMILKSSISFIKKVFDSDMYSISTETGKVIFDPRTFSDDSVITDNEKEK